MKPGPGSESRGFVALMTLHDFHVVGLISNYDETDSDLIGQLLGGGGTRGRGCDSQGPGTGQERPPWWPEAGSPGSRIL